MPNSKWDGAERRKVSDDHDTIIEVLGLIKNGRENFEEHMKSFNDHKVDDQSNFNLLRRELLGIQKVIWIATGVIISVQAIPMMTKILHILDK